MYNKTQNQMDDLFPETIEKEGEEGYEYGLTRENEQGILGTVANLFSPVKREVLKPEKTTYRQADMSPAGVYDVIYTPAEYGDPEFDISYMPIVRGTKEAYNFAKDFIFSSEKRKQTAEAAASAAKQAPVAIDTLIRNQIVSGIAMTEGYDSLVTPEGDAIVYDPLLVTGAVAPAGIQALRAAKDGDVILGIFGGTRGRSSSSRKSSYQNAASDVEKLDRENPEVYDEVRAGMGGNNPLLTRKTFKDQEIFQRSGGAFYGEDGMFRYEIPTKGVELMPHFKYKSKLSVTDSPETDTYQIDITDIKNENLTLGDVLKFDALYNEYPILKKYKVTGLDDEDIEKGVLGSYSPSTLTFRVKPGTEKQIVSTLLHEAQHAVDHIEYRQHGANPEQYVDEVLKTTYNDLNQKVENGRNFFFYNLINQDKYPRDYRDSNATKLTQDEIDFLENYSGPAFFMYADNDLFSRSLKNKDDPLHSVAVMAKNVAEKLDESEQATLQELVELNHKRKKAGEDLTKAENEAHQKYLSTPGEVDARNVQTRFDNPEMQMQELPLFTQDRPKDMSLDPNDDLEFSVSKADDKPIDLPPPEAAQKTQIATTGPTYAKAKTLLDEANPEGKTLDFGAGRGLGAKEIGADTYEPFPREGFDPTYTDASSIPDASYEKLTSLNVLNVVPRDMRDGIVKDIGRVLKPNGQAIVTTRGRDVLDAKGEKGPEDMSIITSSGTYQKGFTQKELTDYIKETLGEGYTVEPVKGLGKAGVKITKDGQAAPRRGYNPADPNSRVFHLTKNDYTKADVVGKGFDDIGFHVGTAAQASARGAGDKGYDQELLERMSEGERILPMVLKDDLKPARIPDMSSFKSPNSWLNNLSISENNKQDMALITENLEDAQLLMNAPSIVVNGERRYMLPDVMRINMDEKLWEDLIREAARANRVGLDTINNQRHREEWFTTIKNVANRNGYDSYVYRNEYEGTSDENIDDLVKQIKEASEGKLDPSEIDLKSRFDDSYMLLEPNQAKGLFGKMSEDKPEFMLNEGGVVPMKKQMELFDDGGLMQEGGTVDPVSGNDVPVGSTQEEVRDDIPARLSEGEFVFPADVVRYFGLETLMKMRQEAKQGLQMMDAMGQMGNSDEATLPDDIPFDINDLDMEDDGVVEYNEGGVVQQQGFTGVTNFQPQQYGQTYTQYQAPQIPTAQPLQQAAVPTVPTMPQGQVPSFESFTKAPEGTAPENREYINPTTGERRTFVFIGGKSTVQIPEGFIPVSDYDPTEAVVPTTSPETTRVVETQDERDSDTGIESGGATTAFGGNLNNRGNVENAFSASLSFDGKLMPPTQMFAMGASLASGNPLPEDMSATLTNITVPRPEGVYAEKPTAYSVKLKMSGKTYNDLFTGKNVTDRTEMEDLMKDIVSRYGEDYLTKTKATLDVDQLLKDKRERDAEAKRQAEAKAEEDRQARVAQRIEDEGQRQEALDKIAQKREERILYGTDDDADERQSSGTTVSGADLGGQTGRGSGATAGGYGGTGRGRSDIGMAKGGMAKQMKKSGLASKK